MKKIISALIFILVITTSCSSSKKAASGEPGTSFQTAIPVDNVHQEYEYIKKNCDNCRVIKQTLRFYKKKPYDIITAKPFPGEPKDYYFDISSFYGKNLQ